jgi:hypothetical protein
MSPMKQIGKIGGQETELFSENSKSEIRMYGIISPLEWLEF